MSDKLRVAVVGVGYLGQHHARLLAGMSDVDLAGIVDTKPGRAGEIGSRFGAPAFTELRDLPLDRLDAVTVAVPTVSHLDVAMRLMDAGVSVLVEKPLATTVADARAIVDAAERAGTSLMVDFHARWHPLASCVTTVPLPLLAAVACIDLCS